MTPQERDLITSLLARLQQAGNQPKEPEADALIRQGIAQQPDAPYLLVQTVLIQDMALAEAHRRVEELERQAAPPSPPAQPASFLAGARGSVPPAGPWGAAQQPQSPPPPQRSVWSAAGAAPAYGPAAAPMVAPLAAPGASSGFLRQAATTAAGIAGGALLFEGISSLFGPHYGSGMFSGMTPQPGLGETVINNYYNDNTDPNITQADDTQADDTQYDPGDQDASSDQDFGSDDSGGTTDI
jgi:hypothetical protein